MNDPSGEGERVGGLRGELQKRSRGRRGRARRRDEAAAAQDTKAEDSTLRRNTLLSLSPAASRLSLLWQVVSLWVPALLGMSEELAMAVCSELSAHVTCLWEQAPCLWLGWLALDCAASTQWALRRLWLCRWSFPDSCPLAPVRGGPCAGIQCRASMVGGGNGLPGVGQRLKTEAGVKDWGQRLGPGRERERWLDGWLERNSRNGVRSCGPSLKSPSSQTR